jgi:putative FmdB family regulatory protein
MPTYEYACKSCGEHLEVAQSFKDDPLTTCPQCGGALRKVFGSIGIAFKGSGFYKTDSRPAPKSDSTSSSSPSSAPSKPAETKPSSEAKSASA